MTLLAPPLLSPLRIGKRMSSCISLATAFNEIRSPSTRKLVRVPPPAAAADCLYAIESAGKAFTSWSSTTPSFKADIFRKAADVLGSPEFSKQNVRGEGDEAGMAGYWASLVDVKATKELLVQSATLPYEVAGDVLPSDMGSDAFAYKRPMGVILFIIPWNAPLGILMSSVVPALAAGNAVVLCTSEQSPACQQLAGDIFKEASRQHFAGLPDGVLNTVHVSKEDATARVSEMIAHPAVRKIAFVGSDLVGKIVAAEAAKHLKPCALELGGKAPAVILDDANVEAAARAVVSGAMISNGQSCLCTKRAIVQRGIANEFIRRVKAIALRLKVGGGCKMSCSSSEAAAENIVSMVNDAVNGGACLLAGDMKHDGPWVQPHVVLGAKPGDRLWDRESFGPVLAFAVVDTVEDAITMANATSYSSNASIWTEDVGAALQLSRRITSCRVWVNPSTLGADNGGSPSAFGGSSGYGSFDIDTFLDSQLVCLSPSGQERRFFLFDD
ncbi:hypothetical protein EIP91_002648 [Steccherinum ochraceum]|uniref:Aldehyde dehydrogenase domain-containing protein n=1 Tax=Steccherinum ochraceum TaxID=92696 RepID=A0A4R0S0Q1_9APHY|nr:hypothetical protein EIP91_002648 [Steccherinum ochraceum]